MDFSGVSISLRGGIMDRLYKEWSGISHLDNAGNAVHDSVECTDFAEYCIKQTVEDLEELREKYAEKVEQPDSDSLCPGLNNAAIRVHKDSVQRGYWNKQREAGTLLMLVVTELAEAMEAYRIERFCDFSLFDKEYETVLLWRVPDDETVGFAAAFKHHVKDTFEDEIVDAIRRLLDIAGSRGIDVEKHLNLKSRYNRTRPYMHGKNC